MEDVGKKKGVFPVTPTFLQNSLFYDFDQNYLKNDKPKKSKKS